MPKPSIASVNRKDGEVAFLVTLRGGAIIGGCGVGLLAGADPEIGYWYGVPFWGRGYATEAAQALIDFAFNDLAADGFEGGARVSNPASRRVLEKCGYVWTGVALTRMRALGGVSVPCDRFQLDREQWAAQKYAKPSQPPQ